MNQIETFLKAFLLAYFLPSCLFVLLSIFLIAVAINGGQLITAVDFFKKEIGGDFFVPVFLFTSGTLSYGLNSGNYQIIRLLEGYKFRWCFFPTLLYHRWMQRHLVNKRNKINAKLKGKPSITEQYKIALALDKVSFRLETFYPKHQRDVLPTKLGNIFRAFEDYPREKYGIETIAVWPRLLLVLPSNEQQHLEDAQSAMMFFLVTSFLFYLFASEVAVTLVVAVHLNWELKILIGLLLSAVLVGYLLYRISLDSVQNFGELVKALYDLRRKALLKELNISIDEPLAEERKRWETLSTFFLCRENRVNPFYDTKQAHKKHKRIRMS